VEQREGLKGQSGHLVLKQIPGKHSWQGSAAVGKGHPRMRSLALGYALASQCGG
jgi:hypothetical protein